jgi:hypothetical protein
MIVNVFCDADEADPSGSGFAVSVDGRVVVDEQYATFEAIRDLILAVAPDANVVQQSHDEFYYL